MEGNKGAEVCERLCILFLVSITPVKGAHAVVQLVEALCYKPEGHGFDSR